ncbi:TPA: DUF3265 domain-containing protein [Vibrio parahaemolyticus]|nr:DUF3265 domain-containing protein [Vibrio parahaemolyticus]
MTKCSRRIHNAWYFHHALALVNKVVYSNLGIALFTP